MADNFLDNIPSIERERIKKRMRSPEAYEALREKVKGPEDLEKHLEQMDAMAEMHFALESEPEIRASLKSQVEKDIAEQGIESVLDTAKASVDAKKMIEEGKFSMNVEAHAQTSEDALHAVAEGKVQEKIPVKKSFTERYASGLLKKGAKRSETKEKKSGKKPL